MLQITQITPNDLFKNRERLESYLKEQLSPLVNDQTWMKEWKQIAQRFRLLKFKELTEQEALSYEWNLESVQTIIEQTISEVKKHIRLEDLKVTVVPALPFPWFEKFDQSIWTNGFTNGKNNMILAIPPNPDHSFLQYMIAHEAHHACPENPMYSLTLDTFTLLEWYKMEGTAEYFSLSLYEDKRWWKDEFTEQVEREYWKLAKEHLFSADEQTMYLRYGDPNRNIPYLAGYAFALGLVRNYTEQYSINRLSELYEIEPNQLVESYKNF